MTNELIARLAAANPVPADSHARPRPFRMRRLAVVLAVLSAAAVPMAAFADDIGDLFGFSNHGTPVPATAILDGQDTGLEQAMQQLGFPSTAHLLATRDGISFYAAQKPDGSYCFAIRMDTGRGVGCTLDTSFPSAAKPVLLFPTGPHGRLAGFAVDGVASVAILDDSGSTVATASVSDNVFVGGARPANASAIEALDVQGNVLATRPLPR
jgi:hypothetical protein